MRNIIIDKDYEQELLKNIKTSLIHTGIEIIEYTKNGRIEYLELVFPFTTSGNILKYQYDKKYNELILIDSKVYTINEEKDDEYEELVDRTTIKNIFRYCREQLKKYIDSIDMERIYNMIIDEMPLTQISLIEKGYTEDEINFLLEENILTATDNNEYTLSSTEKLYRYGIKLILSQEGRRGNKCFEICFKINPTNREICLQLLQEHIRLGNYLEALKLLSYIETISSNRKQNNNNLYLYMLSKLIIVPEEYQEKLQNIQFKDVLMSYDSKKQNISQENEIRIAIMKSKYKYALNLLNDILTEEKIYNVEHALIKEFLIKIINQEEKFKFKLLHFAKTKQYGTIILFLNAKMKKRKLNITEKSIYLIVEDILEITRTKKIPSQSTTTTSSLYTAIEERNYELAKNINENFLREHNVQKEDILKILLTDITELIERIKEGKDILIPTTKQEELPQNYDHITKHIEDLAYYINSEKLSLKEAELKYQLTLEQVLLIKLIYARDYYIERLYHRGDELIYEVETSDIKSTLVEKILNEIKANRMLYNEMNNPYTRVKIKQSN